MAQENKAQVADLLAQIAAQEHRATVAEKQLADEKARADKAEGELESLRVRLDEANGKIHNQADVDKLKSTIEGLTAQLAKEKAARMDAESPDRLREAVKARVAIESAAVAVLGDRVTMDTLSDRELMCAVVEKLQGRSIDASKSDDYVRARFDAAIEGFSAGSAALARVNEARAQHGREQRADAMSAREKMIERNRNAWRAKAEA